MVRALSYWVKTRCHYCCKVRLINRWYGHFTEWWQYSRHWSLYQYFMRRATFSTHQRLVREEVIRRFSQEKAATRYPPWKRTTILLVIFSDASYYFSYFLYLHVKMSIKYNWMLELYYVNSISSDFFSYYLPAPIFAMKIDVVSWPLTSLPVTRRPRKHNPHNWFSTKI